MSASTFFLIFLSFSLCRTPKRCSSSRISKPRFGRTTSSERSRCVPMRMSICPEAAALSTSFCLAEETKRLSSPTLSAKPESRERKSGNAARQELSWDTRVRPDALPRRPERRPQSNLRFAEPHVSAYKPIHRFGLSISARTSCMASPDQAFPRSRRTLQITVQLPERGYRNPWPPYATHTFQSGLRRFFDSLAGFFLAGLPGSAAQTIQRRLRFSPALKAWMRERRSTGT